MEQVEMTADTSEDTVTALSQAEAMDADARRREEWQQPTLLPSPSRQRPRARSSRANEHIRQIGLVGIAQARLALEEASKRARQSAEHRAA